MFGIWILEVVLQTRYETNDRALAAVTKTFLHIDLQESSILESMGVKVTRMISH